jgi:hypothetical protein
VTPQGERTQSPAAFAGDRTVLNDVTGKMEKDLEGLIMPIAAHAL